MNKKLMEKLVEGKIGIADFWRIAKQNARKEIETKADEKKFELRVLRKYVFKASDAKIAKIIRRDLDRQIRMHKRNFAQREQERKSLMLNGF